jgi:hypothetical protein
LVVSPQFEQQKNRAITTAVEYRFEC